jgi:hypothetical protein
MVDQSQDEVLRFGAGESPTPLRDRARRHPLIVGVLVLLLVVGAVGFARARSRPAQAIPLPTVAASLVDQNNLRAAGAWAIDPTDGRPKAAPAVQINTALVFDGVPAGGATLVGIEGQGITKASANPAVFAGAPANITSVLTSTLDCDAVTLPIDASDYSLTVRTTADGRTRTGPTKADAVVRAWTQQANTACGAWLARRDLTVSAVSGQTRSLRSVADLDLTITNKGTHDTVLAFASGAAGSWATPASRDVLKLPAGTSRVLRTRVTVPACDRPVEAKFLTGPPLDTDQVLGIVASTGSAGAKPVRGPTPWLEGTGADGIVFDAGSRAATESILERACGGLNPFAVVIREGGVHFDAAARLLRVDLEVDGSPGKVQDVVLTSEKRIAGDVAKDAEFVPLWSTTARLNPDRTGQSRTTITYRAPRKSVCGRAPVELPGFKITARVPEPAGVRVVHFNDFGVPWQESVVKAAICP